MKKKILIYGGGSYISKELIKLYEKEDYNFIIFCRNKINFEKFLEKNNLNSNKFQINETHIQNLDHNFQFIKEIKDDLSGIIWVAGFTGDPDEEYNDPKKCKENLTVNFLNPVIIINELSKKLIKSNKSFVVIFSSVAGIRGRAKRLFYASSKSGLISYASGLRQKFNSIGIKVITIIPGYMKTKPFNIKAPNFLIAEPKHVAKIVYDAIKKNKTTVYIYSFWRFIMFIIKIIPEKIYKTLNF